MLNILGITDQNPKVAVMQSTTSLDGDASLAPFLRIFFFLAFVISAIIGSVNRDPLTGFDEITHLSYIAHIQSTGELWPRLESLRILDANLVFSNAPSYLNHPPLYYDLLATLGPRIEGNPAAVQVFRLMNVAIAALGFGALLALGRSLKLSRLEEYAWLTALLLAPAFASLAGTVNNDNLAIAAGAVAILACFQLAATRKSRWLFIALAAVVAAGMAKLTGLLLVGGLVAGVLAYLAINGQSQPWWLLAAIGAAAIAAAPYLVLWWQYGSPAPNTPGQIALLTTPIETRTPGFTGAALSLPGYAANFVVEFVKGWMPVWVERTTLQLSMLAAPAFALVCALAGAGGAAKRLLRAAASPTDIVVVAGFAVAGLTAVLHLIFSYHRHVDYGVVDGLPTYSFTPDAYPRYYMPLMAIVPLACGLFLASRRNGATHRALAATMISGPIALIAFGAPSNDEVEAFWKEHRGLDIYHLGKEPSPGGFPKRASALP